MAIIASDFLCEDCKSVWEVYKHSMIEDFPTNVKCPSCGKFNTHRIYSVPLMDVCSGNVGNAKTGYGKQMSYHKSKYTEGKGTKVK